MKNTTVRIGDTDFAGLEVELPGAPLVMVSGRSGFVMCGYLNLETADKLNVAAARVRGVKTVDDLLAASIDACSAAAAAKGVKPGMSGRDALSLLG